MPGEFLCLSRDVPDSSWFAVPAPQVPMLVMRDPSGHFGALPAVCPHRGFPLARPWERGCFPIRCGLHGLELPARVPANVSRVGEALFYGAAPRLPGHAVQALGRLGEEFGRHLTFVKAPLELWMRNTMDPGHLPVVHRGGFAELFASLRPVDTEIHEDGVSSYRLPVKAETVKRYANLLGKLELDHDFFHAFSPPHLSITTFLGLTASVETAVPRGDGVLEVTTRFFELRCLPRTLKQAMLEANRRTLDEDRDAVSRWAEGEPAVLGFMRPGDERGEACRKLFESDRISSLWKP